jgi:hypothetical protein
MRSNVRRNPLLRSAPTLIVSVCALLTLLFAIVHARLLRTSGLTAIPQSAELHGVIIPPAVASYRFLLETRARVELLLDGRAVADSTMATGSMPVRLERRQHDLRLRYAGGGGNSRLTVLWARDDGHFRPVPQMLLVPERVPLSEVDQRRVLDRLALAVPILWLAIAVGTLPWFVRRGTASSRPPRAVLLAAAALFAIGVGWGAPGPASWAPDEIGPIDVRTGVQAAFADGWATIYPPFHHAVIAALYLPFEAALAAGIGDPEDVVWSGALLLVARSLSILMAIGIVWLVHRIAFEQFGESAAAFAAWITLAMLPLTYYAKTANLDVPYVFWLTLSMLYFARLFNRTAKPSDFYFFTLFAVVAVCTKDQAYGFYVLPAIYLLMAGLLGPRTVARGRPAVTSRRVLGIMAGVAVAAFAILHNLPFNVSGFAEHVRLIAGPGSARYAMFSNTAGGHVQMALASIRQLGLVMSWPVLAICVIAVAAAAAKPVQVLLWLLVPCISYYLTFISVVRYHYDRFFLGVGVVLAIAAGWGLARWVAQPRGRTLKLAMIAGVLSYAVARPIALDVMMVNDPRYGVEEWLRDHVAPAQLVVGIGPDAQLPRSSRSPWTPARLNPELLNDGRPAFLIVNVGFAARAKEGSAAHQTFELLDSGATDYRRVARFRGRVVAPLSWEQRFQRLTDDPFTNLTKVNPTIDVYVRRDAMGLDK